jgi:hypothetical protein
MVTANYYHRRRCRHHNSAIVAALLPMGDHVNIATTISSIKDIIY